MDNLFDMLDNQDVKKQIKHAVSPIGNMIYNEFYLYIWLICFYNVFLFIIVVVNLFLLVKLCTTRNVAIPFQTPTNI
jgi:hypothetical protein